jgi:hypothetical protein
MDFVFIGALIALAALTAGLISLCDHLQVTRGDRS